MTAPPTVEIDPDAAALINEKGGRLYVWIDSAGMKHVHTHPPHHEVTWSELRESGIELFVDDTIEAPPIWVIRFHRLPFHHIEVLWDGVVPNLPWIIGGS